MIFAYVDIVYAIIAILCAFVVLLLYAFVRVALSACVLVVVCVRFVRLCSRVCAF